MAVAIKSDAPRNASGGLQWAKKGDVVVVDDEKVARELLAIPGFSEAEGDEAKKALDAWAKAQFVGVEDEHHQKK